MKQLVLAEAEKIADACFKGARDIGIAVAVAIVDCEGNLVLCKRMDDASPGDIDDAILNAISTASREPVDGGQPLISHNDEDSYGSFAVFGGTDDQNYAISLEGLAASMEVKS